ncbi:MAG: hypothetical protein DCF15_10120, partial [Phormidesmis priestleyi]
AAPSSQSSHESAVSPSANAFEIDALVADLATGMVKKQFAAIHGLATLGTDGEKALVDFVRKRMAEQNLAEPTAAHGCAYQYLFKSESAAAQALIAEFPEGLVCPQSDRGVDYRDLQMLLVKREYEKADKVTSQKLCELAGGQAIERKWVYFTEVTQFPVIDLQAMDVIWGLYSEDKFGWRKQRELWLRLGKNWERLWPQLLWKTEGAWTRYPHEFIWDMSAPMGHLPLSNQLRGVRTMASLLAHPAWEQ